MKAPVAYEQMKAFANEESSMPYKEEKALIIREIGNETCYGSCFVLSGCFSG